MQAARGTAPQLAVAEAPRGFGWVDAVVMLALLGLLWSALHFGKGMLVHFDPASVAEVDPSPSRIPYYAGRTLLRMQAGNQPTYVCALPLYHIFAFTVNMTSFPLAR